MVEKDSCRCTAFGRHVKALKSTDFNCKLLATCIEMFDTKSDIAVLKK